MTSRPRRIGSGTCARPCGSPTVSASRTQAGATRFLELGPSGGLTASIEESLADVPVVTMSALRKDRPEPVTLTNASRRALSPVWTWIGAVSLGAANFVELPTYAFERRRFWLSADGPTANAADAAGLGLAASEHALLGAVVELPASGGVVLTGRFSPGAQGWLADHAIGGVVLVPRGGVRGIGDPRRRRSGLRRSRRAESGGAAGATRLRIGRDTGSGRRCLKRPRDRCPCGVGVFARRHRRWLAVARRGCPECGFGATQGRTQGRSVGVAAGGCGRGGGRRRVRPVGRARVRVWPGVPRIDGDVASRR